jgi:hypothetical protein
LTVATSAVASRHFIDPSRTAMTKEELRDDIGSQLWVVTADHGAVHYEVKCKGHKLQTFETAEAANAYFDRWAPEIAKEIALFDR